MQDSTIIITGGNAGLGYQCAKNIALADSRYHLVLASRDIGRGETAADAMREETGNPNISTIPLDLASLDSVRSFAAEFARAELPPLRGLVCNAGLSAAGTPGLPRTVDGFETIFAVNHLGHFLLTNLLLPLMASDGRIVFVTSDLHSPPAFFPAKVRYEGAARIAAGSAGMAQYCVSKLCNLYCTYELSRHIHETGDSHITVNAFNPGAMSDTGFSRPAGNAFTRIAVRAIGGVMGMLIGKQSTAAESGITLAATITDPAVADTTGAYIDRGKITRSSALSYDLSNAAELWHASEHMTGLTPRAITT